MTNITIGIQARSGSTRYPGKVDRMIGDSTVINHVLNACFDSSQYLKRLADSKKFLVSVVLCVPAGDPLLLKYRDKVKIVEGSEDDVLSRYVKLAEECDSDYIVRITSDCPLIVPAVISKHITVAFMNSYDYTSNVDEKCRTSPDGYDCEVISRKLLLETNEQAKSKPDREHVTTWIRRERPSWAKMGFVINPLDNSALKISIDTPDDETRINEEHKKSKNKRQIAELIYGKKNVHSFS